MDSVNQWVTGKITMRLYKGSAVAVTRSSPHALYDAALAGFGESGGLFSQQASPGFIELWSLQSRMAHQRTEPQIAGIRRGDVLPIDRNGGLEVRDGLPARALRPAAPGGRRRVLASPGRAGSRAISRSRNGE